MNNVFSRRRLTRGTRMYASKDELQRFYGKDKDYYISYNVEVKKDVYTVVKAYSYAVLDMYGDTLHAEFCVGTTEIDTSDKRAMYITVSGLVENIDTTMILNAPKSETGENPPYIEPDDEQGGEGSGKISSAVALDFIYHEDENCYYIPEFKPSVSKYSKFNDEAFTIYLYEINHLKAYSHIDIFGNKFKIQHINYEDLVTDLNSVPSVMPMLFDKNAMTARMLYSYISTKQTGLGLEDLFLDVGDEPFHEDP